MPRTIKPMPLPGVPTADPQPWEAEHAQVARKAATAGFVLLKNEDRVLPLKKSSKVGLYGVGAVNTVKGGTGSGDVNERYAVSIAEGLENTGFVLTSKAWLASAARAYQEAREAWRKTIFDDAEATGDHFFAVYSRHAFVAPSGDPIPADIGADTGIYVISRVAGEGADRDAGPGDYLLTADEEQQIHDLCTACPKVVLLLNAGGQIDLSILDREPNIKAVLLVGQPGMEGGNAVGDVLCGDVPVSGKLTNTWALRYADYPNAATFSHMNGDVDHEIYAEDIYVGYRYFDTFGVPVRFGFGEGLSYTTFHQESAQITTLPGGAVRIRATVKNTGDLSGREVVQAYLLLPDIAPGRELRRLAAFAKTPCLAPGESAAVELCFGPEEAASYCEKRAVWAVPAGRYGLCLGTSLKDSKVVMWLEVKEEKILARCTNICPPQQPIDTLRPDPEKRAALAAAVPVMKGAGASCEWDLSDVKTVTYAYGNPDESGDEAAAIAATLTEEEMIRLVIGDPSRSQGSVIGAAGVSVPGAAAETSAAAQAKGVAGIVLADGPAGLRLSQVCFIQNGKAVQRGFLASMEHGFFSTEPVPEGDRRYQFCTAIPVGSLLSQSWDPEVLRTCGDTVGNEMERFNVTLWLAPGMNIHRNPLCGRNFEYYSEDPLLAGLMAAAMTEGVQRHPGCGTTIKHYACNNQEDNRMGSDSILTERALREVYLKGFGIAVRKSQPLSIMTSYNLINGVHTANNHDICTKVARNEFGFKGAIMTDWSTTNRGPDCTAAGCVKAGNDWTMPGEPMDHESVKAALADGSLSRQDLIDCATRVIRVILRSNRYV